MTERREPAAGAPPSILTDLELTLPQVVDLATQDRNRLLYFLLRWGHFEALHDCLDLLAPRNPTHVSLYDLRARAFLAQDRPEEARRTMEARLAHRESVTARVLLARAHLAREDVAAARRVARALTEARAESVMAWELLGQVELAAGDEAAAAEAYRRLRALRPHSRAYLRGQLALHQQRGDLVTASGYAVQLLSGGEGDAPLSVADLRRLRAYFEHSGERTRVADLDAELARRRAEETDALRQQRGPTVPVPEGRPAAPIAPARPAEPLPTLEAVSVSEDERRAISRAAHHLFGFEALLPGQEETMACVLRGESVLTILPTGGGKSLCYQLPAMLDEAGTTLVISPLIALMKDQVDSLPRPVRQRATTINSALDGDELRHRMTHVARGAYRLVYAAPERLRQPPFLHAVRRAGVNRLVIDEAHCVSMWGHDFRPDYLLIGQARRALGDPPLLAMTATAPLRVRRDILHRLSDAPDDLRVIAGDVTRPNLRLEVLHAGDMDDKLRRLLHVCRAEAGSGIVYAGTRARCEELAALLRRYDVSATHYHAGIPNRAAVQDDFMAGRSRVVVATVAFGMGIDKADIRFIVHFVPPPSLESYYQEAGRAGRDGQPARCLLMYSSYDRGTLTRRRRRDKLPLPFLRQVYAAVKERLQGRAVGQVAAGDLERDVRADETRIRVALSLLEEAGLLRRGPDVPRSASVRLAIEDAAAAAPELAAFCRTARLRPEQWLTICPVAVAREAGLSPGGIERDMLDWQDAGWIDYRPAGRDLLLRVLPPPPDAAARVADLLERHAAVQAQRVDEMAAYAGTSRCRHGYLNAYLGGRVIERCEACDNCVPGGAGAASPALDLPDEGAQLATVLGCVATAPWNWGRRTLVRILRGDLGARPGRYALRPEARKQAQFGALAFRSTTAVEHMLDHLESLGLLATRRLEHGGVVLEITPEGRAAWQDPSRLEPLIARPEAEEDAAPEEELPPVDEALLGKLRRWRQARAREGEVPLYVVFHNRHLRAIAAHRPTTLEALAKVRGVGPKRLDAYGPALIALIRAHMEGAE
jgi:ATP-dependent DNA helicase RecQ